MVGLKAKPLILFKFQYLIVFIFYIFIHLNHILIKVGSAQRISEGRARRAKNNFHAIIVFCKKKTQSNYTNDTHLSTCESSEL